MKIDTKHPDAKHVSVVDSMGKRISGAFSYDTVTGNLGVYLVTRLDDGTTTVAVANGKPVKLYKKIKGLKLIDRRTGQEYVEKAP
jgi:hypothetical protein